MTSSARQLSATFLVACLAACGGDGVTPPPPSSALTVSGPSTVNPESGQHPDGAHRVECTVSLAARYSSKSTASLLVWEGASISWHHAYTGTLGTSEDLDAAAVAEFWGGGQMRPGQEATAAWIFWDEQPFQIAIDFRYRIEGQSGTQSTRYTFRCEPPAPPLEGKYILTTIGDVPVPAYDVVADTLEFFPNLTYTTRGTWGAEPRFSGATGPDPYRITAKDSVYLPILITAQGGGTFSRSGTTLFFETGCCGRPILRWRFDREGSSPDLPPAPSLVATPQQVDFSATRGGTPPDSVVVKITSGTDAPITGLTWSSGGNPGDGDCPNGICPSDWLLLGEIGYQTPATIKLKVQRTDIPAGTYNTGVTITSDSGLRVRVGISYTVQEP